MCVLHGCVNDMRVSLAVHVCHSHSFVNLWLRGTVLNRTSIWAVVDKTVEVFARSHTNFQKLQ